MNLCIFGLGTQVVGIAVVFALLLKPVAVEESEEIEQVLLGKRTHEVALLLPRRLFKHALCIGSAAIHSLLKIVGVQPKVTMSGAEVFILDCP